jgi:hypothetical protein
MGEKRHAYRFLAGKNLKEGDHKHVDGRIILKFKLEK